MCIARINFTAYTLIIEQAFQKGQAMTDKRFARSFRVSPEKLQERVGIRNNNGNRAYHTEAVYCAEDLTVGGDAQRYTFPDTHARSGFRTYISMYGRETLKSYENGWRFATSENLEGEEIVLYVRKIKADVEEKRSFKRPRRDKV